MSPPDVQITPAAAGWYYVRIWDGPGHVNGLIRYPIASWATLQEGGQGMHPLITKPGETSVALPTPEDRAACVGLCPPDREWQTYFSRDDQYTAAERLVAFRRGQPTPEQDVSKTTVKEVEVPFMGKTTIRDARPPSQTGNTADWIQRAWGGNPGQGRLGSGA